MSILQTPTVKFTNSMQLAVQQKQSKLAMYALQQDGDGEMTEVTNLVGSALPERISTRFQQINLKSGSFTRRWAPRTEPYVYVTGVDKIDQMEAGIDLNGAYTRTGAATIARGKDMAFLEGFYGVNYTGKAGQTQVSFSGGNIVPVTVGAVAATGMNVEKLAAAQEVLREQLVDVESERCYMALTAQQIRNLQRQLEMTSRDFNQFDAPVLRDGKLTRLLGFDFIAMEYGNAASVGPDIAALTLDGSGHRRVPFWCESGMAVVTWEDMYARVSEREDLNYALQVYARTCLTATRTEEAKCGQVLCLES
jgi:hypothetical protein